MHVQTVENEIVRHLLERVLFRRSIAELDDVSAPAAASGTPGNWDSGIERLRLEVEVGGWKTRLKWETRFPFFIINVTLSFC